MSKLETLLVEKYRPKTFDEYVFSSDEERNKVRKWIDTGNIPNVLAYGSPGVGKSSLGQVLSNELEISPSDIKIVNASVKGVSFVTEELIPWMQRAPHGRFRFVILEEIDRMSDAAMKALRFEMENYSDTVRFFATANYINKVEPALLSRFQTVKIDSMNEDGVIDYIAGIIEKEGLDFENDEDLLSHIEAYAPDIRKILNSIDQYTDSNKIIRPLTVINKSLDVGQWESIWKGSEPIDPEVLIELADTVDDSNYEEFYTIMYQNSNRFPDEVSAIVLMSEYLDRAQRSANQPLHLKAFLYRIYFMDNE